MKGLKIFGKKKEEPVVQQPQRPVQQPMQQPQAVQQPAQPQQPVQQPKPQKKSKVVGEGENILAKVYGTRFAIKKWYLSAILFFLMWAFVWMNPFNLIPDSITGLIEPYKIFSSVLIAIGLILIVIGELKLKKEKYFLTDKRIIHKIGYTGVHERSVEYEMISHVAVSQTLLEKVFRHGTIVIETVAGGESSRIIFKSIPHIRKIKSILDERIMTIKRGM